MADVPGLVYQGSEEAGILFSIPFLRTYVNVILLLHDVTISVVV